MTGMHHRKQNMSVYLIATVNSKAGFVVELRSISLRLAIVSNKKQLLVNMIYTRRRTSQGFVESSGNWQNAYAGLKFTFGRT